MCIEITENSYALFMGGENQLGALYPRRAPEGFRLVAIFPTAQGAKDFINLYNAHRSTGARYFHIEGRLVEDCELTDGPRDPLKPMMFVFPDGTPGPRPLAGLLPVDLEGFTNV